MKTLFVAQPFDAVLSPFQGSVGIWTSEVAGRLSQGSEVVVLSPWARGQPASQVWRGARFDHVRAAPPGVWHRASRLVRRWRPRASPLFASRLYALDYALGAAARVRRERPSVVHLQNFPQYAPLMRAAAPRAAIVLHMHCDWLVQLDRRTIARHLRAVDLIVGCSSHVVDPARARFPEIEARFMTLPNGFDAERFARIGAARPRPGGAKRLLFVGRVSPEKGVHTLLGALPRILAVHPDTHLEIVGPQVALPRELLIDLSDDPEVVALARFYPPGPNPAGTYEACLRRLIPPEPRDAVVFTGHVPYDQVLERYRHADLVVNPSLSESFGMSLVEAMASGVPVVAGEVGGMPEILRATGGGLLVGKNDGDALAEAVIALLDDPERRARMGARGRQAVTRLYSWDHVAALTRRLHRAAIASRAKRDGPRSEPPEPSGGTSNDRRCSC